MMMTTLRSFIESKDFPLLLDYTISTMQVSHNRGSLTATMVHAFTEMRMQCLPHAMNLS